MNSIGKRYGDFLYTWFNKHLKDELLAHFYKTGEILSQPDNKKSNLLNGRSINVSDLRCLMVNFVWLALFYFHYNMWLRPCLRIICALFAKI